MHVIKYVISGRPTLGDQKTRNNNIKKQLEIQGIPNIPIHSVFKMKVVHNKNHNDFYKIGLIFDKMYELMVDVGIVRELQCNTIRRSENILLDNDDNRVMEIYMWVDEKDPRNKGLVTGLLPVLTEFQSNSFHPPKSNFLKN